MDFSLIYAGKATIADLERLYELGYEFVIEDGKITSVYKER